MPSTRRPPLKPTLPSMRVVAPIRLSIRFCGLLVLLNIFVSVTASPYAWRAADSSPPRTPHLDILDFRLGIDSESAFHAAKVLERQPERGRPCVRRLREAHHSILAPLRQSNDQLHAPLEFTLAQGARRHQ